MSSSRQMVSFRRQYGDVHVVFAVHTSRPPSDTEWDEYLVHVAKMRELAGARFRDCGGVAVTDGGAPNAAQRKRLAELCQGEEPLGAVVSDSLVVRGVVTALSWVGIRTRAFNAGELALALDYLRVPAAEREGTIAELRAAAKRCEGGNRTLEGLG